MVYQALPDSIPLPPIRKAISYSRVSKVGERGDALISPDLQVHSQESYAASHRIEIVDYVIDLNQSGRSFSKRDIQGMVDKIARGEADMVLLWKWSRWGRNTKESLIAIAKIERAGGEVRAAEEDFDPATTIGKFTRDQMLSIAELQSNQISDGWKDTHSHRRRRGLTHNGAPRFGYTKSKAGYTPDNEPSEVYDIAPSEVLKEAYARYANDGVSMRSISTDWNRRGIRTVRGNLWIGTALGRMLDSGFAAGLIRERSKPGPATRNVRQITTFDVWRKGAHEPIIDMDLWEKYKARRLASTKLGQRFVSPVHTLSRLLRCGLCGDGEGYMSTTYSSHKKYKTHSWRCNNGATTKKHESVSVPNRMVETYIREWLLARAKGGEAAEEMIRRRQKARRAGTDLKRLEATVAKLDAERDRADDLLVRGILSEDRHVLQATRIAKERAEALGVLEQARAVLLAAAEPLPPVEVFRSLAESWDASLTPEEHNRLLAKVVDRVVVMPARYGSERLRLVPRWEAAER